MGGWKEKDKVFFLVECKWGNHIFCCCWSANGEFFYFINRTIKNSNNKQQRHAHVLVFRSLQLSFLLRQGTLKLETDPSLIDGVWPLPVQGPYFARFGTEEVDYDTISYPEAKQINDTIHGLLTATTQDLGAGLSETPLTMEALKRRH